MFKGTFSFADNSVTSNILDGAQVPFTSIKADISCANNNGLIAAYSEPLNIDNDPLPNYFLARVNSDNSLTIRLYRSSGITGTTECLPVSTGINDSDDLAFLQIQTNAKDQSTLLYLTKFSPGIGFEILDMPCLSFDGLNDIPQLCMNNRGDGVFVYYNNTVDGALGRIGIGGFLKQENDSFACIPKPFIFPKATLKNRTDVVNNVPFYLDCARNEGGKDNSHAGLIWWNEDDDNDANKKVIRSFIVQNTNTPFFPAGPTNMQGTCQLNRFPFQGEFFKTITWALSPASNVIRQEIYRDGVFITDLPVTQTSFVDRNRPSSAETYTVIAIIQIPIIDIETPSGPASVIPVC